MKILITGATGYIGRRLTQRLLKEKNQSLRIFVRDSKKVSDFLRDKVEIVEGDTFDKKSLKKAVEKVDIAYYLIHSLGYGKDFKRLDRISAENFREACIEAGVKRIIYLGGLGSKETASEHLLSRIDTGEIFSAHPDQIQTIWFRAGVIIGEGSAGFMIIRNLVQKLPVMITPRWLSTKTQPIAVKDVLEYLVHAIDLDVKGNLIVDVGSDQMTFKEMLEKTAKIQGFKRFIFPVPVLTPRLSSYWLILFASVPYSIASALVEGLKSETIVQNDNAKKFFPDIHPMTFEESIKRTLEGLD